MGDPGSKDFPKISGQLTTHYSLRKLFAGLAVAALID